MIFFQRQIWTAHEVFFSRDLTMHDAQLTIVMKHAPSSLRGTLFLTHEVVSAADLDGGGF
jgi:hypothetical protein